VDEKVRILEEARQPNTTVSEVLRRHHVDATTSYRWEKQAKEGIRGALSGRPRRKRKEKLARQRTPRNHQPNRASGGGLSMGAGVALKIDALVRKAPKQNRGRQFRLPALLSCRFWIPNALPQDAPPSLSAVGGWRRLNRVMERE